MVKTAAWTGTGTDGLIKNLPEEAEKGPTPPSENAINKTIAKKQSTINDQKYAGVEETKPKKKSQLKTTLGGLVGNILEWYDFAVYGALVENIGAAFFPSDCASDTDNVFNGTNDFIVGNFSNATMEPTTTEIMVNTESGCADGNLIEGFAVFGGAFLMRPVGALIFGHIGDKYGRKRALELSVLLMCVATLLMGCLPTYAQAGTIAPVLLCFVRLLQGVSVGGELIGSIVYTIETAPKNRYGLYGCLALMTAVLGTALGQGVGALLHHFLSDEDLNDWGWRIPFLFGLFLGFFAIWLRKNIDDSEEFLVMQREGTLSKNPLKEAVTTHFKATVIVFFVALLASNYFYIAFIWLRVYMDTILPLKTGHEIQSVHGVVTGALILMCFCFPPWGYVSDVVGSRRKVMIGAGSALSLLTIPLFAAIIQTDSTAVAFAVMGVFSVLHAGWAAPMCAWMVEAFPPHARYSAVAIGYNVANSVTGGAPLLCTYLALHVDVRAPSYYLSAIAFIGTVVLVFSSRILKITYAPTTNNKVVEVEMTKVISSPTSTKA